MSLFITEAACFMKDSLLNRKYRKISQPTHLLFTTSPFSVLIYFIRNQEQSQSVQEAALPKNYRHAIFICSNKISMERYNTQEINDSNYVLWNSLPNYTLIKEYLYLCIPDGRTLPQLEPPCQISMRR